MAARLGDYLIKKGVIGPEQLQEAEDVAKGRKVKLQDAISQLGYATSEQIARALAELHKYEYYDLSNVPIPPAVVELVNVDTGANRRYGEFAPDVLDKSFGR